MNPFLQLLRPRHWVKNLVLLFPPFFAGVLPTLDPWRQVLLPLTAFCLGASSVYIVNDLKDAPLDAAHPSKKRRPIAAGEIPPDQARRIALLLLTLSLACALLVSLPFTTLLAAYLALNLAYSFKLKNLAVVEILCIAAGFVLRLEAGGVAFGVTISPWLLLSVFLLALFLGAGKRLSELRHEGGAEPGAIRPVLALYPRGFLEGSMVLTGAAVVTTYSMYIVSHDRSLWVLPLCGLGLLLYLRRVLAGKGGDPTYALLGDPLLLGTSLLWFAAVSWEIYH